jgi:hypothetical protein
MRNDGPLLGLMLVGTMLTVAAPVAPAQAAECVPTNQLSALAPQSPLPLDFKQFTSDEPAGCRGNPGTCHGQCEGEEFCGTVVSSDGKRFCGCTANPP